MKVVWRFWSKHAAESLPHSCEARDHDVILVKRWRKNWIWTLYIIGYRSLCSSPSCLRPYCSLLYGFPLVESLSLPRPSHKPRCSLRGVFIHVLVLVSCRPLFYCTLSRSFFLFLKVRYLTPTQTQQKSKQDSLMLIISSFPSCIGNRGYIC